MQAAERGKIRHLELLLDNGAEINLRDDWKRTALTYAEYASQGEAAEYLRKRGAKK